MRLRYVCSSSTCRREIEIETSSGHVSSQNPVCACGATLKKAYSTPTLKIFSKAESAARFGNLAELAGTRKESR